MIQGRAAAFQGSLGLGACRYCFSTVPLFNRPFLAPIIQMLSSHAPKYGDFRKDKLLELIRAHQHGFVGVINKTP